MKRSSCSPCSPFPCPSSWPSSLAPRARLGRPRPASGASSSTSRGSRLADVEVEIEFMGRPEAIYHLKTNKKGGFVRIGLVGGPLQDLPHEDGLHRSTGSTSCLSLGTSPTCAATHPGPNDPCQDLVLKKAEVAVSIGGEPAGARARSRASGAAGHPGGRRGGRRDGDRRGGRQARRRLHAGGRGDQDAAVGRCRGRRSRRCSSKVPDQPVVHFNLGHVYRQKKDFAERRSRVQARDRARARQARRVHRARRPSTRRRARADLAVEWLQKNAAAFEQNAQPTRSRSGATAMNQGQREGGRGGVREGAPPSTRRTSRSSSTWRRSPSTATRRRTRSPTSQKYLAGAPPTSPNVETGKALLAALQKQQATKKK